MTMHLVAGIPIFTIMLIGRWSSCTLSSDTFANRLSSSVPGSRSASCALKLKTSLPYWTSRQGTVVSHSETLDIMVVTHLSLLSPS
jgi:hypothetical protein